MIKLYFVNYRLLCTIVLLPILIVLLSTKAVFSCKISSGLFLAVMSFAASNSTVKINISTNTPNLHESFG